MIIFFRLIVYCLVAIFLSVSAQQGSGFQTIVVYSQNNLNRDVIYNAFDQDVMVDELTFESDVLLQKEEFFYLVDFVIPGPIGASQIITSVERLAKKNKFLFIKIVIIYTATSVKMHYIFESAWTFKKIKIHNVYRGKYPFFQYYLMERGDVFDQAKHDHSIIKIKDFLISEGYFDHVVTSRFEYEKRTKEVIVHISVIKGKRFSYGSMLVELRAHNMINNCDALQVIIQKWLTRALSFRYCRKELLSKEITQLKEYLAKKGFLQTSIELEKDVNMEEAKVDMIWNISLYQKRALIFFGNQFYSKTELLNRILAFGRSAWLLPASLLSEEIVRAYKGKGFWNVEVVTREEKEKTFFIIKEGPRAIIKSVTINNNTYMDSQEIKKKCFKQFLKHSYYDVQRYDEAITLLTNFYTEQGFLSFTVVDHSFIPSEYECEYELIVTVDEGTKKYVTHASVENYPDLDKEGSLSRIFHEKPALFDMKLLEEQRLLLTNYFQSLGYFRVRCKPIIEINGDNVILRWVIDCGEKMHFGKTIVLGSSSFPFFSVSSLLNYKQGDLWDQRKIKKTFLALKELEIFESIHFTPDYTENSDEKSVILKLQLDDKYEVRTRVGFELQHVRKYQTFSGVTYKIGGTALVKNPSNCGDQLRLDLDFARSHREVVGRYRRPWFITWPFTSILQVYSISYDQPGFIGSANDIYTLVQNGFFLGLQKKTENIDIGVNNGFEWMKLHIKDSEGQLSFAQAIDFKPQLIDKMVPFFFIEPIIMFDALDDPLKPTRGGSMLFSLKGMIPLIAKDKDSIFFKALLEQSLFVPIKSLIVALRFRCGHIFYRKFSGIMPSERFYLGGSHSLRGYEADLAPPLGSFVDDDGKRHVVPRGGKTMMNANIELRFSLYKKIGAVIFQDVGVLSGTMFSDFKQEDILAATGFGLRIFTPLGPLRFDIGWKWRKQEPIERSFAWFFTFGQAF